MIKTIVFSDPHGNLPVINEEFDLMLIGGDICPAHDHYNWFQREWLSTVFVAWVNSLPFKDKASKVVFIGGNHDCYLDEEPNPNEGYSSIYTDVIKPCGGRLVYLQDDEYIFEKETENGEIESLKIYGTPWCKLFGRWWFMRDNEKLAQLYSNIPEDLDILLTHDAPDIQGCGKITMGPWAGENAGNKVLAKAIKEKEPKYVFFGHIHSAPHTLTKVYKKDTHIRCVSILDESYYPLFEPFKITLEGHVK
jgi:Icc-related predicted phosphoesterase